MKRERQQREEKKKERKTLIVNPFHHTENHIISLIVIHLFATSAYTRGKWSKCENYKNEMCVCARQWNGIDRETIHKYTHTPFAVVLSFLATRFFISTCIANTHNFFYLSFVCLFCGHFLLLPFRHHHHYCFH